MRALIEPWNLDLMIDATNFHRVFPTVELRLAYMAEFPGEYLDLCGFLHEPPHKANLATGFCPNYSHEQSGESVFRRWDIGGFMRKYSAPPFELPDLSSYIGMGQHGYRKAEHDVLNYDRRVSRATWWVANKLPVTEAERQWLRAHLPELTNAARQCPADTWEAAHMPEGFQYHDVRWRDWRPPQPATQPSTAPGPRLLQ